MVFTKGRRMPRPYPPEFRARAIALVREGRQVKQTAQDLGIHEVALHSWLRQDDVDHGRRPGRSSQECGPEDSRCELCLSLSPALVRPASVDTAVALLA